MMLKQGFPYGMTSLMPFEKVLFFEAFTTLVAPVAASILRGKIGLELEDSSVKVLTLINLN